MLASRVGMIGAFVAVLVLSAELVGAIAVRHHIVGDTRADRVAKLADVDASLRNAEQDVHQAFKRVEVQRLLEQLNQIDEQLAQVRARHSGEIEARRALEQAITARKNLLEAEQRWLEDPQTEQMRRDAERAERLDDQLILRPEQVPNRAGY